MGARELSKVNEGQVRRGVPVAKWEGTSGSALPLAGFNQRQVEIGLVCEKSHSVS